MKGLHSILLSVLTVSLIGVFGLGSILYSVYLRQASAATAAVVFEIESGEGVNQISAHLNEAGIVKNKFLFETFVWLLGREGDFKVGVYQIAPGVNLSTLVKTLTGVGTGLEATITIPEGYTAWQIGKLAQAQLGISPEDWQSASAGQEGFLFPDTYRFSVGSSAMEVVARLRQNFDRRFAQHATEIGEVKNLDQLVILASIIEREVQTDEDRALVSDIFHRRLEIGMALQADSTVNYVTGGNSPSISFDDRAIDSPYNTYKYAGLPPGPISNPGIASIIAANNPQSNDYWYFLTTAEGKVIYAKTYEEQVANKATYLK